MALCKIYLVFVICSILNAGDLAAQDSLFYYSGGGVIFYQIDTTRLLLKFDGILPDQGFNYIKSSYPEMEFDTIFAEQKGFGLFNIQGSYTYDSIYASLDDQESIDFVHPVVLFIDTIPIFILDEFICMFTPGTSQSLIDSLIEDNALEVMDTNTVLGNEYVFRVTVETASFMVDLCNDLYEREYTQFCHPNFLVRIIPDSYQIIDEYYAYQYNIKKTIDYENYYHECWEITTGDANIKIAILDEGIEFHEDMDSCKIRQGYDFVDMDSDPSPSNNKEIHGMQVAGIIFARHNNDMPDPPIDSKGGTYSIVGLAPNCSLIPLRINEYVAYGDQLIYPEDIEGALLFAYLNGADVINNSYTINVGPLDNVIYALNYVYENGRGGLGTAIVFSAGNATWYDQICREIVSPKDLPSVIAVGAVNEAGARLFNSCYGDSLDLVATNISVSLK